MKQPLFAAAAVAVFALAQDAQNPDLETMVTALSEISADHELRIQSLETGPAQTARARGERPGGGAFAQRPYLIVLPALSGKQYLRKDYDVHRFEASVVWDTVYRVGPERPTSAVRAIKGEIVFCDLFDEVKLRLRTTIDEPIAPGRPVEVSGGGVTINEFQPSHQWLIATKLEDMHVYFEVKSILYADGTREDL